MHTDKTTPTACAVGVVVGIGIIHTSMTLRSLYHNFLAAYDVDALAVVLYAATVEVVDSRL